MLENDECIEKCAHILYCPIQTIFFLTSCVFRSGSGRCNFKTKPPTPHLKKKFNNEAKSITPKKGIPLNMLEISILRAFSYAEKD